MEGEVAEGVVSDVGADDPGGDEQMTVRPENEPTQNGSSVGEYRRFSVENRAGRGSVVIAAVQPTS